MRFASPTEGAPCYVREMGWGVLIEPGSNVTEEGERNRLRFVFAVSYVLVPLGLVVAVLGEGAPRIAAAVVVALSAAGHGLGRAGVALPAGLLTTASVLVFPYFGIGSEAASTSPMTEVSLLLLATMIAGLCLPLVPLVAVLLGHVLTSAALLLSNPGIPVSGALEVVFYAAVFATLVLWGASIQTRHEAALEDAAVADVERRRAQELAAVNADLRQAYAQLAEAGRLMVLGELSASVAHEMNTPLMGITMCAAFLADDLRDEDGTAPEMVGRIEAEAARCKAIVEAMLSFGRLGSGEGTRLDLEEVVDAALGLVALRLESAGARVLRSGDRGLPVDGDAAALSQVLVNMLLSASRETRAGGVVEVETEAGSDAVAVVMRYPGRAPQPSGRGRATRLSLGLEVSAMIAADHGGSMVAADAPEGGATITLRLPRASG